MKRIISLALLIAMCSVAAFARGKQPITYKKLPKPVQKEFKKSFPDSEVQLVTSERVINKHYKYTLMTADDTKVIYNEKGIVLSVENSKGIKETFIPKVVMKYLNKTFPNATVTEYECGVGKQVVNLNDKMKVVFTRKGRFLRIED